MIEYDSANTPRKIIIHVSGPQDVLRYQRSVLRILSKIEICSKPALKEDVKAVFDLLGHMLSRDNLAQFEPRKNRRGSSKKVLSRT